MQIPTKPESYLLIQQVLIEMMPDIMERFRAQTTVKWDKDERKSTFRATIKNREIHIVRFPYNYDITQYCINHVSMDTPGFTMLPVISTIVVLNHEEIVSHNSFLASLELPTVDESCRVMVRNHAMNNDAVHFISQIDDTLPDRILEIAIQGIINSRKPHTRASALSWASIENRPTIIC